MNKKFLLFPLLLFIVECGPTAHFIKVGKDDYPVKPEDYEVLVFWGNTKPEREYRVIGLVFVETESQNLFPSEVTDPEVVNSLKKEAKKHGAEAIMDLKITSGYENLPDPDKFFDRRKTKRAEAKAVVFIEEKDF